MKKTRASVKQFKQLQKVIHQELGNVPVIARMKMKVGSSLDDVIDHLRSQEDYFRSESNRLRVGENGNEFSFCLCRRTAGVPLQELIWMPPETAAALITQFADSIALFRQKLEQFEKMEKDFPLGTR